MGLDEEDVEMTVVTDVFEVPAERQSRPVHVIDLMEYMRRHQNDKSLYRSEFAVSQFASPTRWLQLRFDFYSTAVRLLIKGH